MAIFHGNENKVLKWKIVENEDGLFWMEMKAFANKIQKVVDLFTRVKKY